MDTDGVIKLAHVECIEIVVFRGQCDVHGLLSSTWKDAYTTTMMRGKAVAAALYERSKQASGQFGRCAPNARLPHTIGFQHAAFARVCIVIFCKAEPLFTSYIVTPRSAERQHNKECWAGLNRTEVTVSAPHSNDCNASEREVSHSCTVAPEVANIWSFQ